MYNERLEGNEFKGWREMKSERVEGDEQCGGSNNGKLEEDEK